MIIMYTIKSLNLSVVRDHLVNPLISPTTRHGHRLWEGSKRGESMD